MQEKLAQLKAAVKNQALVPGFIHHKWFVKYHLEIVEQISLELLRHYPEAASDVVVAMAWLHDYGKSIDFDNEYATTQREAPKLLLQLGFDQSFADTVTKNIGILDKKLELDLHEAPIEVQIVSSADGCSHLAGPFLNLWWHEHPTKDFTELMADNMFKITKDWDRKIVLPEARSAFEERYKLARERAGELSSSYLS